MNGFPITKRYIVKFEDRDIFNEVTNWDLKALCENDDPEVGYSDMTIQFEDFLDKEGFVGCVIMNHIKNFSEYTLGRINGNTNIK